MIINLGHYCLIFLLFITTLLLFLPLIKNNFIKKKQLVSILSIEVILITIIIASLQYSYIISDFSIINIKENSHITLPFIYKITALWGNHEGSILLWSFLLIIYTFYLFIIEDNLQTNILIKILYIQNIFIFFFLLFTLFTSNPFIYTYIYNLNGSELNPVLQDIVLAIHPPLIYIGYISSSIIFTLTLVILIEQKYNTILKRYIHISGLITWSFLTIGIILGSWWSYYELGWGGWWFWDPVENSALLPWLLVTVLLHSIKYDYLFKWTMFINISIFIFAILGTFFVRSGILVSVHSFAVDTFRGFFIFIFLILIIIGSSFIFLSNISKISKYTYYTYKNINIYIIINNIIIIIIFITVLIGTILPTLFNIFLNKNISIGISFYNKTIIPIIIPLLIVMSISIFIKKTNYLKSHQFSLSTLFFISLMIFLYKLDVSYYIYTIALLLILLLTSLLKYIYIYKKIDAMVLSHFGFFLFVMGALVSNIFQLESIQIMFPGDQVTLNSHIFNFRGINYIVGSNYYSMYSNIALTNKNDFINILFPEKRYYFIKGIYITKSIIYSNYFSDVYAIIGDGNFNYGWYTKYYYRPLMSFIWIGPLFFIIGALHSIYCYIQKNKIKNWL
jgi:cytochrome c-type biogenesis protein CcmF